jgi:hypothetical protein
MRSFFENKIVVAASSCLFTLAFAWNATHGTHPLNGHQLMRGQSVVVAHGPVLPPDPWAGGNVAAPVTTAHGPVLPPDPWAGGNVVAPITIAHGPVLPPDPWAGGNVTATITIAHGPIPPPDPWAGGNVISA